LRIITYFTVILTPNICDSVNPESQFIFKTCQIVLLHTQISLVTMN